MPCTVPAPAGHDCPLCGSPAATAFAADSVRSAELSAFAYASRKEPEFMTHRLVECGGCGLVRAESPPNDGFLASAYAAAAYDSGEEAGHAARTYAACLRGRLREISPKRAAIDVGAGNGALLPWLARAGFAPVVGIEPSRAAIGAADPQWRPALREGVFSRAMVADVSPSLICAFMLLEHLPDPVDFARAAYDRLEPGGILAVAVHDRRGWINRLLGRRSPIRDLEHLQLFDPRSLRELYTRAGFGDVRLETFRNTYPLRYWLRLSPLPNRPKRALARLLRAVRGDGLPLSLPAGNLFATGRKPWTGPEPLPQA